MDQIRRGDDADNTFIVIDDWQRMEMSLGEQFRSLSDRVRLPDGGQPCGHDVGNLELLVDYRIYVPFVSSTDQHIDFH